MTDQPTNRPTDKAGCRVACTRLKKEHSSLEFIFGNVEKDFGNCRPRISSIGENLHFQLQFHILRSVDLPQQTHNSLVVPEMLQVEKVSRDSRFARQRIFGGKKSKVELQPLDGAVGTSHREQIRGDANLRRERKEIVGVTQRRRQTGLIISSANERRALTSISTSGGSHVAFRADDAVTAEAASSVDANLIRTSAVGRPASTLVDIGASASVR